MAIENFKRQELKYLITIKQYNMMKKHILEYVNPDKYHESTISNIYYDTPNFLLIRKSIEKPKYKEKLRIRCYGIKSLDDEVFIELKKKYNGIVYKRRVKMKYSDALNFLAGDTIEEEQVLKELRYFAKFYTGLAPKVVLSYERESYYSKDDKALRITFDKKILWRDYDIDLTKGSYGSEILPSGYVLLEIKTVNGYPTWLNQFLSENKIYKQSFSKYGNVYMKLLEKQNMEEKVC